MRARVPYIKYTKKLRIYNILNFLCSVPWPFSGEYQLGVIRCICLRIGTMKHLCNVLLYSYCCSQAHDTVSWPVVTHWTKVSKKDEKDMSWACRHSANKHEHIIKMHFLPWAELLLIGRRTSFPKPTFPLSDAEQLSNVCSHTTMVWAMLTQTQICHSSFIKN